jgi:hypothetical protein
MVHCNTPLMLGCPVLWASTSRRLERASESAARRAMKGPRRWASAADDENGCYGRGSDEPGTMRHVGPFVMCGERQNE